jgi:hypothetical protein
LRLDAIEHRSMRWVAILVVVVVTAAVACGPAHNGPAPLDHFPDEHAMKNGKLALDPETGFDFLPKAAWTSASETTLHAWTSSLDELDGWGVYAPVMLRFTAPLAHVDAKSIAFVVDGKRIAAVPEWRADPGFLLARPATPLPPKSRVVVAVARSLDSTNGGLQRTPDFDATASRADLDVAARALGVGNDDIALVFAYRTGSPSDEMVHALDLVRDRAPQFHFDSPTAPSSLSDDLRSHTSRFPDGATVSVGTWTELDFRPDGSFIWDLTQPPRQVSLDVLYALPDATKFPPPWPAVIAQHGFGGDRTFGLDVADQFLARGIAVFSIDASSHGNRGSYFAFFNVADPRVARDHLRTTVVDEAQLFALLAKGHIDVDGKNGDDLSGTVSYFGHSMGAIVGGVYVPNETRLNAAVLNAPGASFLDIFQSVRLEPAVGLLLRPAFGLGVDDPAYPDVLPFGGALIESIMEPADPIAYTSRRRALDPPLLIQMNLGDETLPNASAIVLASALDVPLATTAVHGKRDALWILNPADFGYPPDQDPHGMHMFAGAPGIHAQMAEFVSSGGEDLINPAP